VLGPGLVTGAIWLLLGLTGAVHRLARLASRPVVRGIVLGLGFSFMLESLRMMGTNPMVSAAGLVATYLLLSSRRLPAMFVLLLMGVALALFEHPELPGRLLQAGLSPRLPSFPLDTLTWQDVLLGGLLLAIPQLPLSLGNACIAVVAENNDIFPERPVTERQVAVSMGIMNLIAPILGGIPMCHGAGGMAGHVRFGARTGGALVILGTILVAMGFFCGSWVELIFSAFPEAILGVILLFAGVELAMSARDIGSGKRDFHVMLITAGLATWNMGVAFAVGVLLDMAVRRGIVRL